MKNPELVKKLLAELKSLTSNDFELHRVEVLEKDLLEGLPVVEVIDDTHQKFNGVTYVKSNSGHFRTASYPIHRAVYEYYCGEIPAGNYNIHHIDLNKENNSVENLQLLTSSEHQKLHNEIEREKHQRLCPICGKTFIYKNGNTSQIYCSHTCRVMHFGKFL